MFKKIIFSIILIIFTHVLNATCLSTFNSSWIAEDARYIDVYNSCNSYSNRMTTMLCKSEEYVIHLGYQDGILSAYEQCEF